MATILSVIGTRPEAIKMAPVIRALEARTDCLRSHVCVTGQHREMMRQMLDFFAIRADADLDVMRESQSLTTLTSDVLKALQTAFDRFKPDWVVVQGDTTTAMATSLAAFYNGIKVAHVEAGLRTRNKRAPFPEEINRRITGVIADLHFAPTPAAREALLAEGHGNETVTVTGNTVIDALYWVRDRIRSGAVKPAESIQRLVGERRLVLVTAHRRENFDGGLEEICGAIRDLVEHHQDVVVVYPVHPNPNVRLPVARLLSELPRVELVAPLDYGPFVSLLDAAHLILTDSGGIQEEATALGKPIVVMRDITERPEAVQNGNAVLAGAHRTPIFAAAKAILSQPDLYRRMAQPSTAYGDGRAGQRIAEALAHG